MAHAAFPTAMPADPCCKSRFQPDELKATLALALDGRGQAQISAA